MIRGSFDLIPVVVVKSPNATLGTYVSHTSGIGEQPMNPDKVKIEIFFPVDTLRLEFAGTAALRDAEMFGFYTFTFKLKDAKGNIENVN